MSKIAVFEREAGSLGRAGINLRPESLYLYVREESQIYGYKFIGYVVESYICENKKVDKAYELFCKRHPELFKEKS